MRMFKPEFIPRILLSLILFGLGTSFLLFAAPGCACPEVTLGQPVSPSPIYPVWELTLAVLLIGAGIFVLVLPSDKPIRLPESVTSTDSASNSDSHAPATEKDHAS